MCKMSGRACKISCRVCKVSSRVCKISSRVCKMSGRCVQGGEGLSAIRKNLIHRDVEQQCMKWQKKSVTTLYRAWSGRSGLTTRHPDMPAAKDGRLGVSARGAGSISASRT